MITLSQYFGVYASHPDATPECYAAADELLSRVNRLLDNVDTDRVELRINPKTDSEVSGDTNGGFRPQDCPIGARHSSHKQAMAVDVYDPGNSLDRWLTDERLEEAGLYREAPDATPGWTHLTTRAPGSGLRTFNP